MTGYTPQPHPASGGELCIACDRYALPGEMVLRVRSGWTRHADEAEADRNDAAHKAAEAARKAAEAEFAARMVVDAPGVWDDMPDGIYHADPVPDGSLSNSAAKWLLPPYSPAHYVARDQRKRPEGVFDFGRAAHALALGRGEPIVVVDADSWRTKDAQAQRDAARKQGATPLLPDDWATVQAMAEELIEHPIAGELLTASAGTPELSAFAPDPATGVWLRGRFDLHVGDDLYDYKTAASADPDTFARRAVDYGYHRQAAWYLDLAHAVGLDADQFGFIVQEKEPPYAVACIRLSDEHLILGRRDMRTAIDIYAECLNSGVWPGYGDHWQTVELPGYLRARLYDHLDPATEAELLALLGGAA